MLPPFIIIGMHRSGTTFLAKLLEKAGIFMGVVKDHNFEAMHFLSLNQQTLWAAGGDWHQPLVPDKIYWKTMPAPVLYQEHFRVKYRLDKLCLKLKNPPWGWKEPRNTFTLDMWLSLFPGARVIHIVRNPEAVAGSLQRRNKRKGEVQKPELQDFDFCLELAARYVKQGRTYRHKLGQRYLEIQYEDLRAAEPECLSRLEKFCGRKLRPHLKKLVH